MKRIIIAASFLLTAVLLAVLGYMDLKNICGELISSLQSVANITATDDDVKTAAAASDCAALWEEKGERLEIYLNHNELDSVQIDFKSIERYADGDRDIMLSEVCYECINNLEHIVETETPSWGTVL